MKANGTVFKYGDNVDTDVIIPARYLNSSDPAELAQHCMEDIDKDFVNNVHKGDIIVADKNFGCGSSREHAPIAIKAAGVSCVIAETFARIFYRNAINIGLPIIECPEAAKNIEAGDTVEVNFDTGMIYLNRENSLKCGLNRKKRPFQASLAVFFPSDAVQLTQPPGKRRKIRTSGGKQKCCFQNQKTKVIRRTEHCST